MSEETIEAQQEPLIMPRKAAAMLGLSAAVLEVWYRIGDASPHVRIGRKVRYRSVDIEAALAACAQDHCGPQPNTAGTP